MLGLTFVWKTWIQYCSISLWNARLAMSQIHYLRSLSELIQKGCCTHHIPLHCWYCSFNCQVIAFCNWMKVPCYHSSIWIPSIYVSVAQHLTVLEVILPLHASLFVVHIYSYYKLTMKSFQQFSSALHAQKYHSMLFKMLATQSVIICMHGWVSLSIVSCFIIVLLYRSY